jgi:ArsR family transcriptional regulator, lead/cadmium/zinc/bismuth-responsive transcriptional repressor
MKACSDSCGCTVFHMETLNEVQKDMKNDETYLEMIQIYKVYSDLSRIKILEAIKNHALCVCDLAYLLGVSKSAISHQMKMLRQYDLVKSKKIGKMVYYSLNQTISKTFIELALAQRKG